jgi:hypothetical protein
MQTPYRPISPEAMARIRDAVSEEDYLNIELADRALGGDPIAAAAWLYRNVPEWRARIDGEEERQGG